MLVAIVVSVLLSVMLVGNGGPLHKYFSLSSEKTAPKVNSQFTEYREFPTSVRYSVWRLASLVTFRILSSLYFNSEDATQRTFIDCVCDYPTSDNTAPLRVVTMKELKTRFEEWLLAMKLPPHFVEEKLLSTIKDHCMCKVDGDAVKGMLFRDNNADWIEQCRLLGDDVQISCDFGPQFLYIYCVKLQWYLSFFFCAAVNPTWI